MAHNQWKLLSSIALTLSVQSALAGEAWLVIASDLPEAIISVDNVYRGVTPQRLGDTLRVKVVKGMREIKVRKQVDGREYMAQKTVEVIDNKEILVQFNLREQPNFPATTTIPYLQRDSPGIVPVFPLGEMEVPGKNF
jgi:hypothetical protein